MDKHTTYKDISIKAAELAALVHPLRKSGFDSEQLKKIHRELCQIGRAAFMAMDMTDTMKKKAREHPVSKEIVKRFHAKPDNLDKQYLANKLGSLAQQIGMENVKAPSNPKHLINKIIYLAYIGSEREEKELLVEWLSDLKNGKITETIQIDEKTFKKALDNRAARAIEKYTNERARRSFFSADYFARKAEMESQDSVVPAKKSKSERETERNNLIVKRYINGQRKDGEDRLYKLLEEIKEDYEKDTDNQKNDLLKEHFTNLLIIDNVEDVETRLEKLFKNEEELHEFIEVNRIKVPEAKGFWRKAFSDKIHILALKLHHLGELPRS